MMAWEDDITQALHTLQQGGVILYPTDTIWGIGCDATNAQAVQRIYQIKRREDSKALICLVESVQQLEQYVSLTPLILETLQQPTHKPTTFIYPQAQHLAPNLLAADGSIAMRITTELFTQTLLNRLQKPIVSTSANISGEPSPQNFAEISAEIKNQVDYTCNYRQNDSTKFQPSTIIKWENNQQIVLRK